jgi:hypothetical protein
MYVRKRVCTLINNAGGLEREWFGLVTSALFAPELGLFVACGGETGAYKINPLSGKMWYVYTCITCENHMKIV